MKASEARRIVWRRLVEARGLKNRIDAGKAFPWERARLAALVREARLYHRLARAADAPPILPPLASRLASKPMIHPRRRTL